MHCFLIQIKSKFLQKNAAYEYILVINECYENSFGKELQNGEGRHLYDHTLVIHTCTSHAKYPFEDNRYILSLSYESIYHQGMDVALLHQM